MTNYEVDERTQSHFELLVAHEIGATDFLYDSAFIGNILLGLAVPQLLFDPLGLPSPQLVDFIVWGCV